MCGAVQSFRNRQALEKKGEGVLPWEEKLNNSYLCDHCAFQGLHFFKGCSQIIPTTKGGTEGEWVVWKMQTLADKAGGSGKC